MLLPEVLPRAKALFASGFGYLASLMATIYSSVRLLPPDHPYLDPKNTGRFGLRHVIAEAANNLVFKRQNLDQIVIFFALLAGIVILCLQFILLIYAYIIQPVFAQSIFETPEPTYDIAFMLLDHVFGVPDLFNSCVNQGIVCDTQALPDGAPVPTPDAPGGLPLPFHTALHGMFQFYSMGLLLVGVFIFLYFVVVVVVETATTGTPFGQRFQNIFVPIRLVVALGLLLPINYGLSSGQYIALYSAKWGSSFATNAWHRFNNVIRDGTAGQIEFSGGAGNPIGESESILANPTPPNITPVVEFLSLAQGCAYAYWKMEEHYKYDRGSKFNDYSWTPLDDVDMTPSTLATSNTLPPNVTASIQPFLVKNVFPWNRDQRNYLDVKSTTEYTEALDFYDNGDIVIRFGRRANDVPYNYDADGNAIDGYDTAFKVYRGGVEPTCGEMRIPIYDIGHIGEGDTIGGADLVQKFHFDLIKQLWFGIDISVTKLGSSTNHLVSMAHRYVDGSLGDDPNMRCAIGTANPYLPQNPTCLTDQPGAEAKQALINEYQPLFMSTVEKAWVLFNQNADDAEMKQEVLDRGWGGAGIWYNKIAEINGVFISTVMNIPAPTMYPLVMEEVAAEKSKYDSADGGLKRFETRIADKENKGIQISVLTSSELQIARALNDFFQYWHDDGADNTDMEKYVEGNMFKNTINMIFGTNGLFEMRGKNAYIHPLSQLSAVGKGLVEGTIRNVATSSASAALGGLLGGGRGFLSLGNLGQLFGDFLITTAFVGVTAGFVLFYVLPFLPFVYFYFAVGAWVKGLFEAMVGIPLWALAHLRLDGEGLPGESASSGYFLILESFLRPILTVFALVASLVLFTAQVRVLNFIWDIVTGNLTGSEVDATVDSLLFGLSIERDAVDHLFYTIIYTIVVYMLATSSFKLIDRIPDNILRWMGVGVSSFSDINQDAVEGLTKYAAIGGLTVGQKVSKGTYDLAKGMGQGGRQGIDTLQELFTRRPGGGA